MQTPAAWREWNSKDGFIYRLCYLVHAINRHLSSKARESMKFLCNIFDTCSKYCFLSLKSRCFWIDRIVFSKSLNCLKHGNFVFYLETNKIRGIKDKDLDCSGNNFFWMFFFLRGRDIKVLKPRLFIYYERFWWCWGSRDS